MKLKYLLILIILTAAFFRFFRLWVPENFYFDEVYHAFTAKELLLGNPSAWEFSATPPSGFAYEWTHPPLAKLLMTFGMVIFGQNSFGWRFFGALSGVGVIYLIYLLGKKLFRSESVGLLASAILTLEGLTLVQSRIGMNDTYFLFFILVSLYALLNKNYLVSGLFFGFSLSSKWTAFWALLAIGVFLIYQINLHRHELKPYLIRTFPIWVLSFVIIPPLIYLLVYTPFFLQGRDFSDFWDLQKQMYWYHTGLKATHPYQSLWYNWPLLVRPVWYFVDRKADLVANIYAMGNPIIFWFGIWALLAIVFKAVKERTFAFIYVVFLYLVFFVPWVVSPRIMFHYHYLPSLPFLAIIIALFFKQIWHEKWGRILTFSFVGLCTLSFLYFYPHWTAVHVPQWLYNSYFWLPSWR